MSDSLPIATPPRTRVAKKRPRDERVRRFKRQLLQVAPHLNNPALGPLVQIFVQSALLSLDSYEFLRTHGLVGADGELRHSVHTVQLLFNTQLKLAAQLGLTPLALQALKAAPPDDLAALASRNCNGRD
jgi:hypothetical protein